jgi:predicted enzyme related to lactoylglutathione lyase
MPKVTGIGGVFFKAKGDHKRLAAWYQEHLGIKIEPWGGAVLRWSSDPGKDKAATAWNIDEKDSDQYGPGSGFRINYRVDDIEGMVANLRKAGIQVEAPEASEFGKFTSVMDPEGNKVELWQP